MEAADVNAKLEELRRAEGLEQEEWDKTVNGAKILQKLFSDCLEGTQYQKTIHSVALTKWLIRRTSPTHWLNYWKAERLCKQILCARLSMFTVSI